DKKKFIDKRLNLQARSLEKRECECKIQQLVSAYGLTPKIIATHGQYKLQQYIVGESPQSINSVTVKSLARQLSVIHQLPAKVAPLQCLATELKCLKENSSLCIDEKEYIFYMQLAICLDKSSAKDTLCHGDLSLLNILETASGKVKILDWEYAVLACSAYDLASCCCINQLNKAQQNNLLNHYYDLYAAKLKMSKIDLEKEYVQYISLFRYINKLWASHFEKGSNSEI
ncbi:hypothetical protein JI57_00240, partial [Psychromonas sp. PRT-SC03]